MIKRKNNNLVAWALVGIIVFIGLVFAMVAVQGSADNRNQAWEGKNGGSFLSRFGVDSTTVRTGRLAGVDPTSLVVGDGECDPTTFVSTCTNDVFDYCTGQGLHIRAKCSDYNASCGTVPQGRNKGKQVCIPNDLPSGPSGALSNIDGIVVGECDPAQTSSSCTGSTMSFCTKGGKLLEVDCSTYGSSCGTLPNGKLGCLPPSSLPATTMAPPKYPIPTTSPL